jgi:hypothetical protein
MRSLRSFSSCVSSSISGLLPAKPFERRRNRIALTLLALSAVAGAVPVGADLRAQSIEPGQPTECDEVVVSISRIFSSDCDWSARSEVEIEDRTIRITLEAIRGSEICLAVISEETFLVRLAPLPAGDWVILYRWTDGPAFGEDGAKPFRFTVTPANCGRKGFHLGDANGDGDFDIADPVRTLMHLFGGGAERSLPCAEAADVDRSSNIDITDAIFSLQYLFLGGPAPFPPPAECSPVPAVPLLGCEFPSCRIPLGEDPIWVERPDGCMQCDPCPAPTLEELVQQLEEMGIDVIEATELQYAVCEACHVCASGRSFAVLVPPSDAKTLLSSGWIESTGPRPR